MKLEESQDYSFFWNPKPLLTYNRLFYVIVGNRGGGKTFGCKELVMDDFINEKKQLVIDEGIKHKQQFAYVRRYKEDLKKSMPTFFNDIAWKYPEYEFKVEGEKFYMRLRTNEEEKVKWTDDDIIGYGFTLSTANNLKSVAYPFITKLIFDEFLLEKGNQHYLPNEVDKLLNLYETIARPGTNHPKVVLFMLANAISISNPYFLYWELKMPSKQDKTGRWIWTHKDKPILVEDVRNETFIDRKKNTEFGSLVDGTKYGDYSINNKFYLDDPDTFIEKKGSKARYFFTFTYKEYTLGVWADFNEGKIWVSKDIDPSYLLHYSLTLKDHKPNTLLINTRGRKGNFKIFIDAFKNGQVYFESVNIKNITYEVFKMVINT